jgi:DNA-binding beta-propeller fold protein YncE
MNRRPLVGIFSLAIVGVFAWWANSATQENDANPFQLAADWPKLPAGLKLGGVTGIAADAKDQIYVFHRTATPILVLDREGRLVRSWGEGLVKTAHGIRLDPEGNVWITDLGHHTVTKFDPTGKVLLTLGTKDKPGEGNDQFNKPADVAFGSGGEIYVADGYGNSRVMKFAKDGTYLKQWGKRGTAAGEFHLPHAVCVDSEGKVYVGDRENNRVQVFDGDGKYLNQWKVAGGPFGLFLTTDRHFFVAEGRANRVDWSDAMGKMLATWGKKGIAPGDFQMPHGICADSQGNVYVAEVDGKRIQKFSRRKG